MNKKQLKEKVLTRLIERVLSENQPATKPKPAENPDKEVETKPGSPNTDEPGRKRRDLRPDKDKNPIPKHTPAKATKLKEDEMLQKIVDRFKSKKVEEDKNISPIQAQKIKKLSTSLSKEIPYSSLAASDLTNFNKSLKKPYSPIKKDDMSLDKYLDSKNKKK